MQGKMQICFYFNLYDKQNNPVLDNSLLRYTPYKRDKFYKFTKSYFTFGTAYCIVTRANETHR